MEFHSALTPEWFLMMQRLGAYPVTPRLLLLCVYSLVALMFTPPTESHRGKAPCEAAAKKMATFDVPVGDTATNSEASALRRCLRRL
jgi:hypothetical protein